MKPASARAHFKDARDDIPGSLQRYFANEDYDRHSPSAHEVWREVLRRNEELSADYGRFMHPAYAEGMRALDLPTRIPRVSELNERLEPTGWRIVAVDGYIPSAAYVGLMARSIFPVSRVIRRPEHIDFAPAPDMVHDILGHLPLLFSPEHRCFLGRLATVMTKAVPNAWDHEFYEAVRHMAELRSDPAAATSELAAAEARVHRVNHALTGSASEVTCLRRMYVWSIEFGLLGDPEDFSIHGAALLSSPAEFRAVCRGGAEVLPYSLDIVRHENAFSDVLDRYFVARDFSQLIDVLAEYAARMKHPTPKTLLSDIRSLSQASIDQGGQLA